jgi:Xaa-Pro aminopeptidase
MSELTIDYGKERIPDGEYAERLLNIQRRLQQEGLGVGLAYATEHMPGDVQYLTGYDPHLENVALLVLPHALIVLGGAEGEKMFGDMGRAGVWRNLSLFEIPFQDYGGLRFYTLAEILHEFLGELPAEIGLLSAPNVLSQEIVAMAQKLSDDKQVHLRDVSHMMAEARYRKSPAELQMFRIASRIATAAMRAMLDATAPGVRELAVAAAGDAVCKKSGAYGYGFDTMVCSGPRINTIIGRSTNRTIQRGDLVMLGVSPRYEGYTSALGRTVVAGGATAEQAAFLDHGIHAHELAIGQLAAGRPAREVDLAARRYLTSVGLGQYHTYGVGHGIGFTECLEEKTATQSSAYNLPPGIAMMIDVGLFGHPLFYGARHEDPYLIAHDGKTERLTDLAMKVYRR